MHFACPPLEGTLNFELMKDLYIAPTKAKTPHPVSKSSSPAEKLKTALAQEVGETTSSGKPKTNSNPLSAFAFYPRKVNFEIQARQEKVILLLRRHPITNLPWLATATVLILIPNFISFLPLPFTLPPRFQTVFLLIWYLITLAFIFENFLSWFFNVNIVTDERIIDFDFSNLIYKDISDAKLDQIQDVRVVVSGVIRVLFNYGDVFIQTAAERPNFEFLAVPHPERVSKLLDHLRQEEEQEKLEGRIR